MMIPIGLKTINSGGDFFEEQELQRERPALPAHFVCHLHPHQVKIGRRAVRLPGVGLNPQNDAIHLQFIPRRARRK